MLRAVMILSLLCGQMAAGAEAEGGKPAAKTTVEVVLVKVSDPAKKIALIKLIREITELGLKDAKDIVDKAPQTVKKNVPREEAEKMKVKLEKEGAVVELK